MLRVQDEWTTTTGFRGSKWIFGNPCFATVASELCKFRRTDPFFLFRPSRRRAKQEKETVICARHPGRHSCLAGPGLLSGCPSGTPVRRSGLAWPFPGQSLDQGPVPKTRGTGPNSLRGQNAKKTEKVEKWGKNCLLGPAADTGRHSPARFVQARKMVNGHGRRKARIPLRPKYFRGYQKTARPPT